MVSPAPLLFHDHIVAYLMNKVNDREPKNFLGDRKIVRCFLENVTKKQAARRQPVSV
jgi:hypothetical protein